jgi:transposase
MIDGTIIRAHQHAAGARGGQESQALGRSCGGFSSKIHAKVDALGMPLAFVLTAGQVHDSQIANELVADSESDYLLADRGYDSDAFRESLRSRGITPVIPGKKNRIIPVEYDKHIYKERNLVERFFNRIKHFRRIATRYDKTSIMFLGSLTVIAILLWGSF